MFKAFFLSCTLVIFNDTPIKTAFNKVLFLTIFLILYGCNQVDKKILDSNNHSSKDSILVWVELSRNKNLPGNYNN